MTTLQINLTEENRQQVGRSGQPHCRTVDELVNEAVRRFDESPAVDEQRRFEAWRADAPASRRDVADRNDLPDFAELRRSWTAASREVTAMPKPLLLDTDVLVDHSRGRPDAVAIYEMV